MHVIIGFVVIDAEITDVADVGADVITAAAATMAVDATTDAAAAMAADAVPDAAAATAADATTDVAAAMAVDATTDAAVGDAIAIMAVDVEANVTAVAAATTGSVRHTGEVTLTVSA